MPSNSKKSNVCKVTLNILGYRDDSEWVALALEMDLRGYGKTFDEALNELKNLVLMQISFAHFKGHPEMILKPADAIWFERFAEVRHACLASMLKPSDHHSAHGDYKVTGLPIPPAHVIEAMRAQFKQANA
jgi:hypothetical protein